jgi:CysZ protein
MSARNGPRELPTGLVAQVFRGFNYPLEGLATMRQHRLWRLAAVPIAVNIVLFVLLVGLTLYVLVPWIQEAEAALTPATTTGIWATVVAGLAKVAVWAMWILAPVAVLVINAFLLVFVGQAVASPFLDLLSERVEVLTLGIAPAPTTASRVARSISIGIADVIWGVLLIVAVNLPLLLLNLVPVVGSAISAVLGFGFNALLLAVVFTGLPLTRYFISYPGRWHAVWHNKWLALGLGAGIMILMIVPLVNLVLLPLAAVGGTLCYCDLRAQSRLDVALPPLAPNAGKRAGG